MVPETVLQMIRLLFNKPSAVVVAVPQGAANLQLSHRLLCTSPPALT